MDKLVDIVRRWYYEIMLSNYSMKFGVDKMEQERKLLFEIVDKIEPDFYYKDFYGVESVFDEKVVKQLNKLLKHYLCDFITRKQLDEQIDKVLSMCHFDMFNHKYRKDLRILSDVLNQQINYIDLIKPNIGVRRSFALDTLYSHYYDEENQDNE